MCPFGSVVPSAALLLPSSFCLSLSLPSLPDDRWAAAAALGQVLKLSFSSPATSTHQISGRQYRTLSVMSVPMYKKQNSLGTPAHKTNPFDSDSDSEGPSRAQSVPVRRTNQSVQELEDYAITKARETTHKVNDCVRAAEAIREDATQTMLTLHHQGEQIMRSHQVAADIEQDLTVSEKLLGSLGGLFSKSWRPKRNQQIKGPASGNNYSVTTANHTEQRWKLGIAPARQEHPSHVRTTPVSAMEKIQAERSKQDDALSDLCSTLGQLKEMAVDMGTEIDRQNKALVPFSDDVDELNFRLKGANQRGRRLLGK